jgi:hypothetical protein
MNDDFYIIESISDDEIQDGYVFYKALNSIEGFDPRYTFVNNYSEFVDALEDFSKSDYLYLMISCHGDDKKLYLIEDSVEYDDLDDLTLSYLKRRIFMSSCKGGNLQLAKYFIPNGAYSLIGCPDDIPQIVALVLWPTMLMRFDELNDTVINFEEIDNALAELSKFYRIRLNYYSFIRDNKSLKEYKYNTLGRRVRKNYD